MSNSNQSFFERLTGTVNLDEQSQQQPQQAQRQNQQRRQQPAETREFGNDDMSQQQYEEDWQTQESESEEAGELAIDLYETPEHIVVQTMAAGVRPDHLDVSITRNHCTISGRREAPRDVAPGDYFHQELYWGKFTRSVELPEEVEVDDAEASESHGLLTITLPKIKKDRETKLEVSSH